MKKDVFICDNCGTRSRRDQTKRHWCDVCTQGIPVELRCVREKRLSFSNPAARLTSPAVPAKASRILGGTDSIYYSASRNSS